MEIVKGTAVISKAGRDKDRVFAVVDFKDDYFWLADGKLRPLSRPKKKKIKHLNITKTVIDGEYLDSDSKLSSVLSDRFGAAHR